MWIILILIILIILISILTVSYHHLINLNYKIKKKIILWLVSVLLAVFSLDPFHITGLFLCHFLLFAYLIELIYFIIKKIHKKDIVVLKKIKQFFIIPLILVLGYFSYGYYNMNRIVATKYQIKTEKKLNKDYKIVYLSDVHYGTNIKKTNLEKAIKDINELKPDLVFLGGDIVDESTTNKEMQEVFSILGNIKAKYGLYYVYGNHDQQSYTKNKTYELTELNNVIKSNNISILKDESVIINDEIILYGRDDISNKRKKLKDIINQDVNNNYFSIVLDHEPLEYKENKKYNIDLILSGHTHAGQIFPAEHLINLIKTSDLAYGYQKTGNLNAIVSSGLSGWGYPVRTSRHSEYVVIEVNCK